MALVSSAKAFPQLFIMKKVQSYRKLERQVWKKTPCPPSQDSTLNVWPIPFLCCVCLTRVCMRLHIYLFTYGHFFFSKLFQGKLQTSWHFTVSLVTERTLTWKEIFNINAIVPVTICLFIFLASLIQKSSALMVIIMDFGAVVYQDGRVGESSDLPECN
jgi:hypothetical protein